MLTISGASDDTIQTHGDVEEEWGAGNDDRRLVALSTGHAFSVTFGDDGWEVRLLAGDPDTVHHRKDTRRPENDVAEVRADVAWVLCADRLERSRTVQPTHLAPST